MMRAVFLSLLIAAALLGSSLRLSAQGDGAVGTKPNEANIDAKKGTRPFVSPPLIPIEINAAPNVDAAKPLDPEKRLMVAQAAADYLCRVLDAKGMFVYEFNPHANANTPQYNWLRHAGSIVALCQIYDRTKSAKYMNAALLAAEALKRQTQEHTFSGGVYTVVVSDPKITNAKLDKPVIKTGGCALAAIAFMKIDEITGKETYKPLVLKLCSYLRYTQMPNGELRSRYVLTGLQSYYMNWASTYYQGEALVALAMVCKKYPNKENRRTMHKLLDFIVRKMRKVNRLTVPNAEFDHWGIVGLCLVYPQLNDNELGYYGGREPLDRTNLLATMFKYCKNELDTQHMDPQHRFYGCFKEAGGRTSPVATRLEGLTAFVNLLRTLNNPKYNEQVGVLEKQIAMARQFLASCQYKPEEAARYKTNINIAGGFRAALYLRKEGTGNGKPGDRIPGADSIRIDYCQHAISAMLGW